ncbi:MAG: UDP-N-acetylglucosamine 1-carboxyvinyltransferase [Candidatus Komeilibacteria bacterium CG10_big_fil_rev_8_21_14_0_10_41_13]|uniref:UDP-N-acetylglucosamine 1-carboxyvinyltransferase n=1 Tax=Candidatus Komeilibacteria bacterium CG10_big_fil_rev_8_21_14_0_10_41_13 TaxID=1974476 RepID=A0A2M6WC67_9BACT|nr:MAG: UDP-N-acetylglucosamine 1-carboxyvinyltransferase [Candidatus Komeilibacteria bacterium CG10_big_fil_rev_8_21_14_0_10_41_13]
MSYYKIQGGYKLSGSIEVNSPKNSAMALLSASLLNKGKSEFLNFPNLEETKRIIEVLESIGVKCSWKGTKHLVIEAPKKLKLEKINYESASKTRTILMFLGPLVNQFKSFKLPIATGCKLGSRTISPYIYALENFGVEMKEQGKYYQVKKSKANLNREIIMYESGDTATACVMMAAALTNQTIKIKYASANYQIQELGFYLQKLGVKINGLGTSTLEIKGLKQINKNVKYTLAEDPIEAMFFLSLAATTNSSLLIKGCPIDFLDLELLKLKKMGFNYEIKKKYLAGNKKTNLVDLQTKPSKLIALKENIHAKPYPGINIDNLPFFVPIATQAKGTTLIFDWVYENRAIYYTELTKLGAKVNLSDPHRAFVEGPTVLKGAEVMCPPALRPSSILVIAMLAAKGESILRNTYNIARGFEDLHERLRKIGAKIEIIND